MKIQTHDSQIKHKRDLLIAPLITGVILLVLFVSCQFAPFGDKSLAAMDANIQYLDFFAYLKDVFKGDNSAFYTFSKSLGGNNIAVFAYYLTSPFNLLALFFDKSMLNTYFDIRVALELMLATFTFEYFLHVRFAGKIDNKVKRLICIMLAVSYGLCQYNIAQSSNIMWLDGVYMLPLIMLGIHRLVREKTSRYLIISVALAILFNWYSAGLDCVFSGIWFVFEIALYESERVQTALERIKNICMLIVRYVLSMACGVCISAVLFLPTYMSLKTISRGSINLNLFEDMGFAGRIPSVISNYFYGAKSVEGSVALFAGSLAMIGCIACFISKKVKLSTKISCGFLVIISIFSFFWLPEYRVFSLFTAVFSYWYRHSYLAIFALLFIAAQFYFSCERSEYKVVIKSAVLFAIALVFGEYVNNTDDYKNVYFTFAGCLFISLLLAGCFYFVDSNGGKKGLRNTLMALIVLGCVSELGYNAALLMKNYNASGVEAYEKYVSEQSEQIDQLKDRDKGIYRISQTSTRLMRDRGITANFNESLAYNYRSISSYTSVPEEKQFNFLEKMGYRRVGANISFTVNSVLGADSFLGVKYILSEYPIKGLEKLSDITDANGKSVYRNPYALPMAFVYKKNDIEENTDNPFEYQNSIYSKLLGREVKLYTPLSYEVLETAENGFGININVPAGDYIIYGNLPWSGYSNADLDINGQYNAAYSQWISPSVFYIPCDSDKAIVNVTFEENRFLMDQMQFYALDLNQLKAVSEEITGKSTSTSIVKMENGDVELKVTAGKKENLFLSVPADNGWTVTLNGKKTEAELFADCMYSIPLKKGDNTITLKYSVPGLTYGAAITAFGLLALTFCCLSESASFREKFKTKTTGKRSKAGRS